MSYNLVPFENWVEFSKSILESMYKDAKVYKITALVFLLLSIIIAVSIPLYWPASLITLSIGAVFFQKSRHHHYTLFMQFEVKEKQVYEYADDISGQQLETNYLYQYVLRVGESKSIKISPKGLNIGKMDTYDKIILTKEIFAQIEVGDIMDVLIGSDKHLYAFNLNGKIQEFTRQIPVEGRILTAKTSVYQQITNFGKRVR
ncbi:MAG: hypothetical protein IT245_08765 [Bacteroidia bacterium]|nr:hypothetical protein [Bacteroidia bacterium]